MAPLPSSPSATNTFEAGSAPQDCWTARRSASARPDDSPARPTSSPPSSGDTGEVLDLGRTRRVFTPAQRKTIRLLDRRCRAEGCHAPTTRADIHHQQPPATGGTTDLTNGISLCSHHHRRIHDTRYHHTHLPNGDVRFHCRT